MDQLPDLDETLEALRELAQALEVMCTQCRHRSQMKFISAAVFLISVFHSVSPNLSGTLTVRFRRLPARLRCLGSATRPMRWR